MEAPRVLVLVRHAQAKDRAPEGGGDAQRELTKAGRRVARAVGEGLAGQGVRPDLAVVSPSARTVATCEELQAGGLRIADVWADAALYDADVEDVLDSIREVPDDVRTLVVIGHAPGVPAVAGWVENHTGRDDERLRADIERWATAGLGVIVHEGPWASFPAEGSALVLLQEPPAAD